MQESQVEVSHVIERRTTILTPTCWPHLASLSNSTATSVNLGCSTCAYACCLTLLSLQVCNILASRLVVTSTAWPESASAVLVASAELLPSAVCVTAELVVFAGLSLDSRLRGGRGMCSRTADNGKRQQNLQAVECAVLQQLTGIHCPAATSRVCGIICGMCVASK